jgi:DNA-binding Xre family transcriptional regulator
MYRVDERLIRVRSAELNINRGQLAAAAGITEMTLRNIINGGDCKLTTLSSIASVLQLTPADLLIANGEPELAGVAA